MRSLARSFSRPASSSPSFTERTCSTNTRFAAGWSLVAGNFWRCATACSIRRSPMIKNLLLGVLCLIPITVRAAAAPPKDISGLLGPIINKHDVPGMAAAVVHNGEVVAIGVAGVRTRGKADKIAIGDRFHLGSDTKAMTAMLCGILVDEGKLRWGQTLGETFPELKKTMNPQYQAVTLEQLLTHRGGAPGELEKDPLWLRLWQYTGTPTGARRLLLEGVTAKPPEAAPGTTFIYSNAGVSIAGHMAEKVTGKSWEDLMR